MNICADKLIYSCMIKMNRPDIWRRLCTRCIRNARLPSVAAAALCVLAALLCTVSEGGGALPASAPGAAECDSCIASDTRIASDIHIALTFDDGPYAGVTQSILDTLEQNGVTATFFVLGSRVEGREETLLRMEALGCEIGNHGWSHADLTRLSAQQISSEIDRANAEFLRVLGHTAAVVRPPYGHYNATVRKLVPYPLVLWSVDTKDWQKQDPSALAQYVIEQAKSGCVVLMHDQQRSTAEAMGIIIPTLVEAGFRFVTVSELIEETGGQCGAVIMPPA